jgi:hypothetical protein
MTRFPTGPRPPLGHPGLSDHLRRIGSCHEAAHAVTSYHFKVPHKRVLLQLPIIDRIVNAGVERDVDATNIAYRFLDGIGASSGRAIVNEMAVLKIAWFVNVNLNLVPSAEANGYAIDDVDTINELQRINGLDRRAFADLQRASDQQCRDLLADGIFLRAVEVVAAALLERGGEIPAHHVGPIIEAAIGNRLRNSAPEPPEDNIRLAAFYLSRQKGPNSSPLENWLSAERGLRFGIASNL